LSAQTTRPLLVPLHSPASFTSSKSFTCHSYALFHSPYPATPVFATLTKTTGVYINSSHSGTAHSSLVCPKCSLGARPELLGATKSFTIRTCAKCAYNSFTIRTSNFIGLKTLQNPHIQKNPGGHHPDPIFEFRISSFDFQLACPACPELLGDLSAPAPTLSGWQILLPRFASLPLSSTIRLAFQEAQ
jgi:hypothetical protein